MFVRPWVGCFSSFIHLMLIAVWIPQRPIFHQLMELGQYAKCALKCLSPGPTYRWRSPILTTTCDLEILVSKDIVKELQRHPILTQISTKFCTCFVYFDAKKYNILFIFCLWTYEKKHKSRIPHQNFSFLTGLPKRPISGRIEVLKDFWSSCRISFLVRTANTPPRTPRIRRLKSQILKPTFLS